MNKKIIIIGIDGVPYGLMEDLSNKGVMTNFRNLRKEGIFQKMRSSIPHISSVAWSSVITGNNPAEHGIFGFMEINPRTYELFFPNFENLKKPAFWYRDENKKYVILNVPSTYPPKELNGVHISGFVSPKLERAIFPKKSLSKLREIGYKTDVDSSLAHRSKNLFLEDLFQTTEAQIKAFQYFWEKEDWDIFMLIFTGSDRLEHFLWDAYKEKNHQYHQDFCNYFKRVDEVIGEIANKISQDDALLILSDHGMERIKINFSVNYFLKKIGLLDLDESLKGYNQITSKTKAFALDPGRIYLHKRSKYLKGKVREKEEENIIQELTQAFSQLEKDGEKVIKRVYRKEEIYQGKEKNRAPDLVLVENPGYRLRGSIEKKLLFEEDIFTGKHTLDDAFLYVKDENYREIVPENPTVEDVVSILNAIDI